MILKYTLFLLYFAAFAVLTYESLYMVALNLWCALYGLGNPYIFWG